MKPQDVHPTHDVREEGLYTSDPVCQICGAAVHGSWKMLVIPCPGPTKAQAEMPDRAEADHMTATEALLADYIRFAGETAGKCLGLAMSTEHPSPDEVLMGIFEDSQALAEKARDLFHPKRQL